MQKTKKKSVKQSTQGRKRKTKADIRKEVLQDLTKKHSKRVEANVRFYRFGFWLFFILVIFSVAFSVVAINSIYSNFQVVTNILDESFERTNLVLDITSSKINSCTSELEECRQSGGSGTSG